MTKDTSRTGDHLASAAGQIELRERVGVRCATFLHEQYLPPGRAKKIAREVGCSPNTAKEWLGGKCPENRHLFALMARFGARFNAYVYGPALGWTGADDMERRLNEIRREADRLARDLAELRASSPEGGSPDPASHDANPPRETGRAVETAARPPFPDRD